jgi:HK97 family phage prohead protease
MSIEKRVISGRPVELRANGEGPPTISGYAAVFYREGDPTTQYELWPGAVERVTRGAFDSSLGRDDVRALFNHDPHMVLGRDKAGTLKLSVDETGLRYEITPGDTTLYKDVSTMIQRGDVDGSSFSFQIEGKDVWTRSADGLEIRELRSVKLYDVGPVTFPAYAASTSEARSARDSVLGQQEREEIERELQLRRAELSLRS